jgi:multisubunit Na+/H+ antiporter MnhB subunit
MEKEKIKKKVNRIYLIILILVLLISCIVSFKTGENLYRHTSTLSNKNTVSNTYVASWNFDVRIEY